jgi:hypothetical protein
VNGEDNRHASSLRDLHVVEGMKHQVVNMDYVRIEIVESIRKQPVHGGVLVGFFKGIFLVVPQNAEAGQSTDLGRRGLLRADARHLFAKEDAYFVLRCKRPAQVVTMELGTPEVLGKEVVDNLQ